MDEECRYLLQKSALVLPIDIFESPGTHEEVVERLIRRWNYLAEKNEIDTKTAFGVLTDLLKSIRPGRETIVFFGSAVYAVEWENTGDIDIMRFTERDEPFVNPTTLDIQIFEDDFRSIVIGMDPALMNVMLFYPGDNGINRLPLWARNGRMNVEQKIEELVTVAVGKIMEKKGYLKINPGFREKVKEIIRKIERAEMEEMTFQALRRIRIKEREIPRITKQFVQRIMT